MLRVHRTDVGARIRADHKTVQGHVRIPAAFSRTGVQTYTQADGSVRREYRPPEEVFSPKSIASFDTATVVEGHPAMIDSSNWDQHGVGDVRGAHRDGDKTAGDIIVRKQSTIDKINADGPDALREISCGYDCELEMKPGTSPEGEKYDAIQRNIVINHIGLGPAGWGRAGSEVRLRLDGGAVAYLDEELPRPTPLGMTPEQIAALQAQLAAEKARADGLQAILNSAHATSSTSTAAPAATPPATQHADARAAKLEAERDEAIAKAKELEAKTSQTHVDGLVQARFDVIDGARLLHGKTDIPTTGTVREIQIAAIVARDPSFKADGRSDDYIRSRFDAKVEDAKKAQSSLATLNQFSAPTHVDGAQHNEGELAELKKRFDQAFDFPELYAAAEPWRNGETAARKAALDAMKKG